MSPPEQVDDSAERKEPTRPGPVSAVMGGPRRPTAAPA